jgi:bifunctional DNA-binding transcriptional regulator/antitoxin component of YhaV-PrlF toxin-antitoxin module
MQNVTLRLTFDFRHAVLQYYSMTAIIPISKRGTITLPPAIRRKLALDRVRNPMMLVEEKDGRIILEPAATLPLRDIPKETIDSWVSEDEAAMEAFKKTGK